MVWAALLAIAIVNGAIRQGWLIPRAGDQVGHQISTVMLSVAIVLLALGTIPWVGATGQRQALLVGAVWVGLTLTFEFVAGHYAFGKSWAELLADYDVAHGRIWVLVLITTGLAPLLATSLRALPAR
jgi:hypothetical protein